MKNLAKSILSLFLCLTICSCHEKHEAKENKVINTDSNEQASKIVHSNAVYFEYPAEYELNDSSELTHVKGVFYKNKAGYLYERTIGQEEMNGHLVDHEYFNGNISQEVDPFTFQELDGWYAIDKNNVYYYRPLSGGMQIIKIDEADVKSFKILDGNYKYANDINHFYKDASIIENYSPLTVKYEKDKKGKIIALISKNGKYKLEE